MPNYIEKEIKKIGLHKNLPLIVNQTGPSAHCSAAWFIHSASIFNKTNCWY